METPNILEVSSSAPPQYEEKREEPQPPVEDSSKHYQNLFGLRRGKKDSTSTSRLGFILTPQFFICLVLGQFLAVCITSTNVTTQQLASMNANIPTFQTLLNYILLALVYTSITIYKYGFKKWFMVIIKDGWKYFLLAAVDVEGNFFLVKAFAYTNLLSAELLDGFAIPIVMILSFFFLKMRYHWTQIFGAVICLVGLGLLVKSDSDTGKNYPGVDIVKGDIFVLIGATCYGFSNVAEEYFVRSRPLYEVVGQMGFWGMFINGVQTAIIERDQIRDTVWTSRMVGMLIAYNIALFFLYTLAPLLFRLSSATFFNLSLLTSDFYGLLFGILLFQYYVAALYPVAFVLVIIGIVIYSIVKDPAAELEFRKPIDQGNSQSDHV